MEWKSLETKGRVLGVGAFQCLGWGQEGGEGQESLGWEQEVREALSGQPINPLEGKG